MVNDCQNGGSGGSQIPKIVGTERVEEHVGILFWVADPASNLDF